MLTVGLPLYGGPLIPRSLSPGRSAKLLKRQVCTGGQGQQGRQSGLGELARGPAGRGAWGRCLGVFMMRQRIVVCF